jgi:two-component system, chemotaxis family, sensor kinase CheA
VVLQVDSRRFGLVFDEVNYEEEIVVRPFSKHLKGIKAYTGATIMGDGKLALILDLLGLGIQRIASRRALSTRPWAQPGRGL